MDNQNNKVDQLITSSLKKESDPIIPDSFANRMMQKIETRMMQRKLISDWVLKILLLFLLVLIVFVGGIFSNILDLRDILKGDVLTISVCIALVAFFIYFTDQVVLKYMFFRFNQKYSKNKQRWP